MLSSHRILQPLILAAICVFIANTLSGEISQNYRRKYREATGGQFVCGAYRNRGRDELFLEQIYLARHTKRQNTLSTTTKTSRIGDLIIIEDDGNLIREPSIIAFDLDGKQLHFSPNANGGYDVDFVPMKFDTLPGVDLNAGDDSNHLVSFTSGFTFSFFDTIWDHLWIRANGNVTFGAIGNPDEYDPNDFISALPMIATFFADLDPALRGRVHYRQEPNRFIVTWDGVTEFEHFNSNTIQLTLFQDGSFDIAYNGIETDIPRNGLPLIVGFNSGNPNAEFESVNFSIPPINNSSSEVLFEAFDRVFYREINLALTARQFYKVQPDSFDQLVMLTNFDLLEPPFTAFHTLVKNGTHGIGNDIIDDSAIFGSAGRLQSFIHMNSIDTWPDPPDEFFLTVLGHETAHRWSALVHFDKDGQDSDLLLGSGLVHWSFYKDTDGSVLFGNDWGENTDGTFVSLGVLNNYSFLDHYLMGLRDPEEIPDFFFIDAPGVTLNDRARFPQRGLVAAGPKHRVNVSDIVAIEGVRVPNRDQAQKVFRQGFILLTRQGGAPSEQHINKLENLRELFADWFSRFTDGRGIMQTRLGTELPVASVEGRVTNAEDGRIIKKLEIELLEYNRIQPVAGGGFFAFHVLADSVQPTEVSATIAVRAFPFLPDTSQVSLTFGISTQHDRELSPLPKNSLTGSLKTQNGVGVKAKLTLHLSSDLTKDFTIVDSSDAEGNYLFESLPVSFPPIVVYDKMVLEPEIPYVTEISTNITISESSPTVLDFTLRPADVLVVNDDPNSEFEEFYVSALDSLNLDCYVWSQKERGLAPVSAMTQFNSPTIIWYSGNAQGNDIITAAERDSISTHLDRGGKLFLTGQNIAQSLQGTDFLNERLHTRYLGNIGDELLHGVQGDPVGNGLFSINIAGFPGANNQTSIDVLRADSLAKVVALYDTTFKNFAAGIRFEDPANGSRFVLFGFGFEAVNPGDFPRPNLAKREEVMGNVLSWLSNLTTGVSDHSSAQNIQEFALHTNFPNPFNGSTVIAFQIPANDPSTHITLEIFNLLGRRVRTLINKNYERGEYTVSWDGRNDSGVELASGVYLYRLKANNFQRVRKLLMIK